MKMHTMTNSTPNDACRRFRELDEKEREKTCVVIATFELMNDFKAAEAEFLHRARVIRNDQSMPVLVRTLFDALVSMFREGKAVVFDVCQPLEVRRYVVAALQRAIADAKVALKE
jgi:hypothetical protein